MIQALVIFFVGAELLIVYLWQARRLVQPPEADGRARGEGVSTRRGAGVPAGGRGSDV